MQPLNLILATVGAQNAQPRGPDWWQVVGALAVVLALLLVSLRLLGRWQRPAGRDEAALVAVWPLGPRREIQILRLRDEVHYIYRHEGGLVVLDRESWDRYRAAQHKAEPAARPWLRLRHALRGGPPSDRYIADRPPLV